MQHQGGVLDFAHLSLLVMFYMIDLLQSSAHSVLIVLSSLSYNCVFISVATVELLIEQLYFVSILVVPIWDA